MLMKVNLKFLNNYPAVFNWAENWAVALPEKGGSRPNWDSYVTCLEDEDRWAACFQFIVLVNSLLDQIAHSQILNTLFPLLFTPFWVVGTWTTRSYCGDYDAGVWREIG